MLTVRASRPYRLSDLARFKSHFPTPFERQSQKLRKILTSHIENKTASRTFGIMDPVQLVQAAPYLDTVYISGWTAASTLTTNNEYGCDFGDYPSNTIPFHVQRLRKAQEFHSSRLGKDILHPIIADADCGFGGISSTMKTTKMLIEAGAAGIHLEDQRSDGKKCGHLGGKVLISMRAHIERLQAARLQADLMDSSLVCISRTDAEAASYIDTDIDERDRPFIIGKLTSPIISGQYTLPEAISSICMLKKIKCPPVNFMTMTELEAALRGIDPKATFNLSTSRTQDGYYPIRGSTEYAIRRAVEFSQYADMQWCETSSPSLEQARQISSVVPGCLAYNTSPSFPWSKYLNDKELREFSSELAKLRYCWQFTTLAGFHVSSLAVTRFARDFQKYGMLAYVKTVQEPERLEDVASYRHQEWSGVNYTDDLISLISSGKRSGDNSTERHF